MKATEITEEMRTRWKRDGYFPVVCRTCNDVILYPSENYSPKQFIGFECQQCKMEFRLKLPYRWL